MSASRASTSCLRAVRRQSCTAASSSSRGAGQSSPARCFSSSSVTPAAPKTQRVLPESQLLAGTQTPRTIVEQVQRYPRHPLNAFFPTAEYEIPDRSKGVNEDGTPKKTTSVRAPAPFDEKSDAGEAAPRSSWQASELRRKSSVELHQLWYVLLMEKNRLSTSYEEMRRALGGNIAQNIADGGLTYKLRLVKKSMSRIKLVLNERRLALLQAQRDYQAEMGQSGQEGFDSEAIEDQVDAQDDAAAQIAAAESSVQDAGIAEEIRAEQDSVPPQEEQAAEQPVEQPVEQQQVGQKRV